MVAKRRTSSGFLDGASLLSREATLLPRALAADAAAPARVRAIAARARCAPEDAAAHLK
jgi:hypothetical protein